MADLIRQNLENACSPFAQGAGTRAIIVQSKSNSAHRVALNETTAFPSASLIKVAIACAAADDPTLDLSAPVSVSDLEKTFYCSILQAFEPSDKISLKALIGLMLIVSDNPATTAVLHAVGPANVNAWLNRNKLADTNLDIGFEDDHLGAPLRVNLTTANDCLRLLEIVDQRPKYAFIKHLLANNLRNERIPKWLPDHAVIAHKTGTLNGLMHDIAIIDSPEAAYYLVILADELQQQSDFAPDMAGIAQRVHDIMSA